MDWVADVAVQGVVKDIADQKQRGEEKAVIMDARWAWMRCARMKV